MKVKVDLSRKIDKIHGIMNIKENGERTVVMVSVDAISIMEIFTKVNGFEVNDTVKARRFCRVVSATLACGRVTEGMDRAHCGVQMEPCTLGCSFMIRNMDKDSSTFLMAP